jgi:hypothetical protein
LQEVYEKRMDQLYAWVPVLVLSNSFIAGTSALVILLTNYCALYRPSRSASK